MKHLLKKWIFIAQLYLLDPAGDLNTDPLVSASGSVTLLLGTLKVKPSMMRLLLLRQTFTKANFLLSDPKPEVLQIRIG